MCSEGLLQNPFCLFTSLQLGAHNGRVVLNCMALPLVDYASTGKILG